jgi:hypothetical protein
MNAIIPSYTEYFLNIERKDHKTETWIAIKSQKEKVFSKFRNNFLERQEQNITHVTS